MQPLKAYGSVPTSNYICSVTSAHIPKYAHTFLTHVTTSLKKDRIKGDHELETLLFSVNTDIVMSEMASEVEGFPPGYCVFCE